MDAVIFFVVAKKLRAQQGFDFRIKMRKERRPTKQKPIKEENIKDFQQKHHHGKAYIKLQKGKAILDTVYCTDNNSSRRTKHRQQG